MQRRLNLVVFIVASGAVYIFSKDAYRRFLGSLGGDEWRIDLWGLLIVILLVAVYVQLHRSAAKL